MFPWRMTLALLLLAPTPTPPPPTATPAAPALCSPLAQTPLAELARVTSAPYAPPANPRSDDRHQGVDFAYYRQHGRLAIAGETVQSVLAGEVVAAAAASYPYGNYVIVATPAAALPSAWRAALDLPRPAAFYLLYAHLADPPLPAVGDALAAGDPLGTVGASGAAAVAHLHLEARRGPPLADLTPLAPMDALRRLSLPAGRAAYRRWRTSGEFVHLDPFRLLALAGAAPCPPPI
jgi:murein DD-endopeptidase MepM/ murein hydrolase activator NlpD